MRRSLILAGVSLVMGLGLAVMPPSIQATSLPSCDLTFHDVSIIKAKRDLAEAPGVTQVVSVQGYVDIEDISKQEVFDYISNLENDTQWYPGTLTSEQICGDGGAKSQYKEVVALTGTPIEITATVMRVIPGTAVWFKSDNVLPNVSNYLVTRRGHDTVRMTLTSSVGLPDGYSEADLETYLELVLNSLLTALGKEGTVVVR